MYAALLDGKLVLAITEIRIIKQEDIKLRNYLCPKCYQRVQLVRKVDGAYFKHVAPKNYMMGEKEEHALSKNLLNLALQEAGFSAQMEISLAAGQLRADVLASSQLAFEVQCAPLSRAEFQHRHELYSKIKITDIWLVGQRHYLNQHLKKSQLIFFRENQLWHDYYLEIDPQRRHLTLKYNVLLESVTEQVHYQSAVFALTGRGLKKLWHFQPQLKKYSFNPVRQRQYAQQQVMQKTIKGKLIAAALYTKQMTIDDLPDKLFTKMHRVGSQNNILTYLKSSADD